MRSDGIHLRALGRYAAPAHGAPLRCERAGCGAATREGKPYCSEHVEEHPYVRALLETIAAEEAEQARVARGVVRAASADGITAREILLALQLHGDRTIERLAKDLQLAPRVVDAYVSALVRSGRVVLGLTSRGSAVARLLGADGKLPPPLPKPVRIRDRRKRRPAPVEAGALEHAGARAGEAATQPRPAAAVALEAYEAGPVPSEPRVPASRPRELAVAAEARRVTASAERRAAPGSAA